MVEAFRGSSPERIDPSKGPVDQFIEMMQATSGDPQQLLVMLAGIVRQVAGAPSVPPIVKASGSAFASDIEAWTSGKLVENISDPKPSPPLPESLAPAPKASAPEQPEPPAAS